MKIPYHSSIKLVLNAFNYGQLDYFCTSQFPFQGLLSRFQAQCRIRLHVQSINSSKAEQFLFNTFTATFQAIELNA